LERCSFLEQRLEQCSFSKHGLGIAGSENLDPLITIHSPLHVQFVCASGRNGATLANGHLLS
jgi:hypothetical protein